MKKTPGRILLLVFMSVEFTTALISKIDNGYSGIVVAIHKSVPEDTELISKTINLFNESSELLYKTLERRAFFKDISIVVPISWNKTTIKNFVSGLSSVSYERTYGEYFRDADVRIQSANPGGGDSPYTLQTGGCFAPGQYIHLTPNFVLDKDNEMTFSYGPLEKSVVHEWMHLRYGIFDEYGIRGNKNFPLFYKEGGEMRPSICNKNIAGHVVSYNGAKCEMYKDGDYVGEDCDFNVAEEHTIVSTSLMSLTYINSITEFCDSNATKDMSYHHNSKAPTEQNIHCNGMSVWDVIRRHEDFKSETKAETYVPPTFYVRQPENLDPRFILVLDVSSSMTNHMKMMKRAAEGFIKYQIRDGSYVGIVEYSTNATILQELIQINSINRKIVSEQVPSNASGYTAIGKGLLEALQVLKNVKQPSEGAIIILMTDGDESAISPNVTEVIPQIVKARVKVNTIAFGKAAEQKLESIALKTSGKTYFFDPNGSILTFISLYSIFADIVTIHSDIELQSEQILRTEMEIQPNVAFKKTVQIDSELGRNTTFLVYGDSSLSSVTVELVSPNGTKRTFTKNEISEIDVENSIEMRLPIADSGQWNISIESDASEPVRAMLLVTSEPRDLDIQPIRMTSWMGSIDIKYPDVPRIYARITKGFEAVIHAVVEANVTTPSRTETVTLKDDGAGADRVQNDGIYSGYFTKFSENGRYIVYTHVIGNGSALIRKNKIFSRAPQKPTDNPQGKILNDKPMSSFDLKKYFVQVPKSNESPELEGQPILQEFTRTVDVGSFSIKNYDLNDDKIPPNRVNDLKVINADANEMVTLQWTSPGNNMDDGNATSLEIRASLDDMQLRTEKFVNAFMINSTHVLENDTLAPSPGGTIQTISLNISTIEIINSERNSSTNKTVPEAFDLYFALRAFDASRNAGEASNIAVAHIDYDIIPISSPDSRPYHKQGKDLLIGVSASIGVLLVFIISYFVYRRYKRSKDDPY